MLNILTISNFIFCISIQVVFIVWLVIVQCSWSLLSQSVSHTEMSVPPIPHYLKCGRHTQVCWYGNKVYVLLHISVLETWSKQVWTFSSLKLYAILSRCETSHFINIANLQLDTSCCASKSCKVENLQLVCTMLWKPSCKPCIRKNNGIT